MNYYETFKKRLDQWSISRGHSELKPDLVIMNWNTYVNLVSDPCVVIGGIIPSAVDKNFKVFALRNVVVSIMGIEIGIDGTAMNDTFYFTMGDEI